MLFNTFIFLQVFNIINARRVNDGKLDVDLDCNQELRQIIFNTESNIFQNIFKNLTFVILFIVIVVVQVIITAFGDIVFSTKNMDWDLWVASISIGALSIPLGKY